MNKLKRFGTIYSKDMTKEIEETIISDENQMKKLYDKIEELEKTIKEKDIEINLFKDQNKIYKDIINKNNKKLYIKNAIYWKQYEFYINLYNYNLDLYDELYINKYNEYDICNIKTNEKNDIKKEIFSSYHLQSGRLLNFDKYRNYMNNKNNIDNSKVESSKEEEKNLDVSNVKNNNINEDILPTPSTSFDNKVPEKGTNDKMKNNKSILEKYPVKIYNINNKNNELLEFIASENKLIIKFQYMIAEKVKDNKDYWEDIYNFKVKNNELKNSKSAKKRFKCKIIRSKILYEKYGENLNNFKISLYYIGDMSENDWQQWLNEFDKLYNEIYNNSIKCNFKYKNGKYCNKFDCKIKHKNNI